MLLRFTKARNSERPHTLTCVRDDGSTIGQSSSDFFIRHDLTHYAVETELGLDSAFYGLLSQGWDFSSFEEREPGSRKSRVLPPQAVLAEIVVSAFDLERAAGRIPNEDLLAHIVRTCTSSGLEAPSIQVEDLERIRLRRNELFRHWAAISPGEEMRLTI